MGGLFSSNKQTTKSEVVKSPQQYNGSASLYCRSQTPVVAPPRTSFIYRQEVTIQPIKQDESWQRRVSLQAPAAPARRYTTWQGVTLQPGWTGGRIEAQSQHKKVPKLSNLVYDLQPTQWKPDYRTDGVYHFLPASSEEESDVRRRFRSTGKRTMVVQNVVKIYNPYLLAIYEAKKRELAQREVLLFHGTKRKNVGAICSDNLDWRLVRYHKFGVGVSFTPISFYATHYCDDDGTKVMFLCRVLVGRKQLGHESMTVPNNACDTATNDNEHVYVKFDDDVFYPLYLIFFIQDNEENVVNSSVIY